jgi:GDP-D-mannose 3',5'-epimerase
MAPNQVPIKTAIVLGAGGFVGTHMVRRLKAEGYWVRGVDLKWPEFSQTEADEFFIADIRDRVNCERLLCRNYLEPFKEKEYFDECIQLAADMGGAGYIFSGEHDADVMHNSAQINLHVAEILKHTKTKVFYSSSACMYPQELQDEVVAEIYKNGQPRFTKRAKFSLSESDAYPAHPDSEYGWEKLFSERLYLSYARNYGLDIRIARFHNIYGPHGTYKGGKEKAPAAMCRKVIEAKNMVEVWGTGNQTRSFLYIDDCIDAVRLLMQSDFKEPINIGSEEMISINGLAEMAIDISGKKLVINNVKGPVGVMGRNSNNDLIREKLGWNPKYSLREGMERTFSWINQQINGVG